MDSELDVADRLKGRLVIILKLLLGTESDFIAIVIDVGYSNVVDGDREEIIDACSKDGPGRALVKLETLGEAISTC